jgi:hypothetical protein
MTAIQGLIWCLYEIVIIILGYPDATLVRGVYPGCCPDHQIYQTRYNSCYRKTKVKAKQPAKSERAKPGSDKSVVNP